MKPLAYSYCRFSHPSQSAGDSLRRQRDLRDGWLKRNGVKLDTSLTLEDKGISGFSGEHRENADRFALAAFLQLVERKRIPKDSYLIVESLDRLSREDVLPALTLVLNLISAGIQVVQLLPVEVLYGKDTNPMQLVMAIMELSRGHSESAMKSERIGGAWRQKKLAARDGTLLTSNGPAWLRLVDGAWEVIPAAADAVRRIFRMTIEGHGAGMIARRFNAENVPTIGTAREWTKAYIVLAIKNPAVFGVLQPHKGAGRKRQPDGKPIAGYYPGVIPEADFHRAQAALQERRRRPGRPALGGTNVVAGILWSARDDDTVHVVNKGVGNGGRVLLPYAALKGGTKTPHISFPFATFEAAILSCLREVNPREVLPAPKGDAGGRVLELSGRLAAVESQEEGVKAKLRDPRFASGMDALAEVVAALGSEKKTLADQLAEARREEASPLAEAWGEFGSLLEAVEAAPDLEDARVRLRGALRRVVEGIWCLFTVKGTLRIAAAQVWFKGDGHRDYLIVHRPATSGVAGRRASSWERRSLADAAALGRLDLRNKEHARRLEKALLAAGLAPPE
jgi:DNA invertase Pin-like site-specific DNA recombinase